MTLPVAPRLRAKRRMFLPLVSLALLLAASAFWWFTDSPDPFAQLEEDDAAHTGDAAHEPAASPFPPGTTPADQLRLIDEHLGSNPNNLTLLSQKIHFGLEFAPGIAAEECRRILQQSPDNYFALHHAAMAYLAMTNLDRAMYYAAKALQARDTTEARFVAGHIFYAKGNFPGALKHYRAILEKNPRDEAARAFVEKTERAMVARR